MIRSLILLAVLLLLSASAYAVPEKLASDVPSVSDSGPAAPAISGASIESIPQLSGADLTRQAIVAPGDAAASAVQAENVLRLDAAAGKLGLARSVEASRAGASDNGALAVSADRQLGLAAAGAEAAAKIFVNEGRRSALEAGPSGATPASPAGRLATATGLGRAQASPRSSASLLIPGAALALAAVAPTAAGAFTLSALAHGTAVLSALPPLAAGLLLLWTIGVSVLHSREELKGQLWSYFGKVYDNPLLKHLDVLKGFVGVVLPALALQAVAAWGAFVGGSPFWLGVLIGGRIGDAFFSHMIPARLGYTPNPGLPTAMIYVFDALLLDLAFGTAAFAAPHALLGLALGAGFFAGLPLVFGLSGYVLRKLGRS